MRHINHSGKPSGSRHRFTASAAVLSGILLLFIVCFIHPVRAQDISYRGGDPGLELLGKEIERLSRLSGGIMGVGAVHIETGREVYLNGETRFPMASTFKIPVAVQIFTLIDRGEARLEEMIRIEPGDLHPGSGTISRLFDDPGVILSLHNLIELMLLISDNSATDIVMRRAGGSSAVTARLRELGIDGIDVSRPTHVLIADWVGVQGVTEARPMHKDEFSRLMRQVAREDRERAAETFNTDARDTATPEAMTALLGKIWKKEMLSDESADLMLDIMRRCETGEGRIKGILPPGLVVYHKTGTIGQTLNDVGLIALPDGAGTVAMAIFVKESDRDDEAREAAVAQVARALYDYFLFNPGIR
ncbi:class A beta-lactamase [candidate division KSB1 bacterium]